MSTQGSSAMMFHKIPHQLVTKVLFTPSPCFFCQKFIWGVMQQAIHCAGRFPLFVLLFFFLENPLFLLTNCVLFCCGFAFLLGSECGHNWHPECEQFIQNDCGLTSQMLAGALSAVSESSSSTLSKEKKEKKKEKPEVQIVNGHVFRIASYVLLSPLEFYSLSASSHICPLRGLQIQESHLVQPLPQLHLGNFKARVVLRECVSFTFLDSFFFQFSLSRY